MPSIIIADSSQTGVYKRSFVRDSTLALYLPLWHPDLSASPFLSKDLNAHSCTVVGATWGLQGRTFTGTDDKITIPYNSVLNASPVSVSFWMYATAFPADEHHLIAHGTWKSRGWDIYIYGSGTLFWEVEAPGVTATITTDISALTSTWLFFTCVYNARAMTIFMNGASVATGTALFDMTFATDAVWLGTDLSLAMFYAGRLGEVLIESKACTLANHTQRYLATKWRYGV